jgi:hypothetical protein
MLELVLELLGRALPRRPAEVVTRAEAAHGEPVEALALMMLGASARFSAPERVVRPIAWYTVCAQTFAYMTRHAHGASPGHAHLQEERCDTLHNGWSRSAS